ncbi:MAG: branched-chain amino acid ABC transporter permease [Acidimicrobiales bacterium]
MTVAALPAMKSPPGVPGSAKGRWAKVGAWVAIGTVLLGFPLVFSTPAVTSIAFFSLIFMASATAWNSFCGYSGYISIGHAVFFGSGAYTLAIIVLHQNLAGGYGIFWYVPVAGAVAMAIAVPYGLIALRTRRHTFVVVTIAAFFIFQLLAYNLSWLTKGSAGITLPTPPWTGARFNQHFYYAALCVLVVAVLLSAGIRHSRFGLHLLAIRDDEDRAAGLGVKTTRVKLIAFVISAFSVGMAGAVWAYFLGDIHPQFAFTALFDLSVAIMAFLGGFGTIAGPLFGAALLESLQQYFVLQYSANDLYLIAYGVLFLAAIVLLPRGVIPTIADAYRHWRERDLQASLEAASRAPGGTPPLGASRIRETAPTASAGER